jgi:hypothetical protein
MVFSFTSLWDSGFFEKLGRNRVLGLATVAFIGTKPLRESEIALVLDCHAEARSERAV